MYLPLILLAFAVLPAGAPPSDPIAVTTAGDFDGTSGGGPWTQPPPPSP